MFLGLVSVQEELSQIVEELNVVNFQVVLVQVVGCSKMTGQQQLQLQYMVHGAEQKTLGIVVQILLAVLQLIVKLGPMLLLIVMDAVQA